jgi:hypothetical protein
VHILQLLGVALRHALGGSTRVVLDAHVRHVAGWGVGRLGK